MRENNGRAAQAFIIGGIITSCTLIFPALGWPMLIFNKLFPPDCPPEAFLCLWSDTAIFATLISEFFIYSLFTYLVLRRQVIFLKRTSCIGKV
ncbi:MAG: hypothetical protein QOC96_3341 [Acidobacteriota bacterium]|jgi:hypothetical protein|nr:hypothetical protein [Acidobacteriota bacterium]